MAASLSIRHLRSDSAVWITQTDFLAVVTVLFGLLWRLWLAHATFLDTDEAWHFATANQHSLLAAYKASLTLAHPPLLILILYFWKHVDMSDLMLRLPGVLAGVVFCWVFYKWLAMLFGRTVAWIGLILATLLPPMIALSAELRQYPLMLAFAVSAAYFLERALAADSVGMMWLSSVCLYLAMLSHYSAFPVAASLGVYAILRMLAQRPPTALLANWGIGQAVGVGLAALLYWTHIARLGTVYPVAQPLRRFGDFYLADWYFHAGRDRLLLFLYRGTLGIFRFMFGQTGIGQVAAVLFFAGVFLQARRPPDAKLPPPRLTAILLMIPFVLNWAAVTVGLYPYGRTRQCIFLAVFGIAGVSIAISKIVANRAGYAALLAVGVVAGCHLFGTLQGRDMLPVAEQRREHMDQALQFLHAEVSPSAWIFTDKATSFQLGHYLCRQKPVSLERTSDGLESFRCDRLRVVATGASEGALSADKFAAKLQRASRDYAMNSEDDIWVVEGGWASGLGGALRGEFPEFSRLTDRSFGRYIEILKLPVGSPSLAVRALPTRRVIGNKK